MYFDIGEIVNTQGTTGEVRIFPLTDDVKRFKKLSWVYISRYEGKDLIKYEIENVRFHKQFVLIKFIDVNSMNEAEKLKGSIIKIPREMAVKLPKNSFFIADLIGIEVVEIDGRVLGIITDVLQTGSNDVYVVKGEKGKEVLIPAIKDVVKNVDIDNKKMVVKLLEGLID